MTRFRCPLYALTLAAGASASAAAGPPNAVTTLGSGDLTICRSWIVYQSCTTYHKVALPERIAVGDDLPVTFGSNPKDYVFRVARIARDGDRCKILSEASGADAEGERIEVAQCQPTDDTSAAQK
jgi:hypothetical protein